jgi:hypothetical protein
VLLLAFAVCGEAAVVGPGGALAVWVSEPPPQPETAITTTTASAGMHPALAVLPSEPRKR